MKYPIGIQSFEQIIEDGYVCLLYTSINLGSASGYRCLCSTTLSPVLCGYRDGFSRKVRGCYPGR